MNPQLCGHVACLLCLLKVQCLLKLFFLVKEPTLDQSCCLVFSNSGASFSLCLFPPPWPEWAPCLTATWERIVPSFLHWHLQREQKAEGLLAFLGLSSEPSINTPQCGRAPAPQSENPFFWAAFLKGCVLLSPLGRIHGKESLPVQLLSEKKTALFYFHSASWKLNLDYDLPPKKMQFKKVLEWLFSNKMW